MGNTNGKEEGDGGNEDQSVRSEGDVQANGDLARRASSVESMGNTPPGSPGLSRSPVMFAPQLLTQVHTKFLLEAGMHLNTYLCHDFESLINLHIQEGAIVKLSTLARFVAWHAILPVLVGKAQIPVAPLQQAADTPVFSQPWMDDSHGSFNPSEKGIPTMITWNYGGNEKHDFCTLCFYRRILQRSGKDHSILLVLSSGIYHYRFIVDGEQRHIPDFPCITDETGQVVNLLDMHDYVPENVDGVTDFESPPSPESSYGQPYPVDEDFAKEPPVVPPQLHLTVLGSHNEEAAAKPQHVVLNHLFIEKGWASQSLVALGLTHRFQSKYVTVVLYKPLTR
ncbi:hypothetical protein Taro_053666 [Colocasia esculenta]|uniref:Association with the SNF1 complex (ASC) domain-containing protein n=1 Tax=Colocasia esculenta TaxID=4460 RepID=A0A843XN96_COLES|nr:hypothetical protein [Colocasia esculenta]